MVANAERRIVEEPSWKSRRGNVLLGPDSEKGEPRRGGSNSAEGRSVRGATGAVGWEGCSSAVGSAGTIGDR